MCILRTRKSFKMLDFRRFSHINMPYSLKMFLERTLLQPPNDNLVIEPLKASECEQVGPLDGDVESRGENLHLVATLNSVHNLWYTDYT